VRDHRFHDLRRRMNLFIIQLTVAEMVKFDCIFIQQYVCFWHKADIK